MHLLAPLNLETLAHINLIQWGDEGKGKLVDVLSKDYDICARVGGGSNAGHTIVVNVCNIFVKLNKALHIQLLGS